MSYTDIKDQVISLERAMEYLIKLDSSGLDKIRIDSIIQALQDYRTLIIQTDSLRQSLTNSQGQLMVQEMPQENDRAITLYVKPHSYNAVKNYIHNELKITKPDVENMVGQVTANVIAARLQEDDFLRSRVDKTIRNILMEAIAGRQTGWNLQNIVYQTIQQIFGKYIQDKVSEMILNKDINVNLTDLVEFMDKFRKEKEYK